MFRRRLVWQIYGWFLVLLVGSLAAATWHVTRSVRENHRQWVESDLEVRVQMLAARMETALADNDVSAAAELCRATAQLADMRVTLIDATGRVLGESRADPSEMESHRDRPEIVDALEGRIGRHERRSPTLGTSMLYAAAPVRRDGRVIAAVRVARSLAEVDDELAELRAQIALGGVLVALIAAVVAYGISRRISRPLVLMRKAAECFARGDLGCKLPAPRSEELASLCVAMNDMAAQLDQRIRTITHQRNELEAVLASMVEAVVAVDADERLLRVNRAAGALFAVDPVRVEGRSLQESIRNPELQRFVARALAADAPVEGDIAIEGPELKFLQAHGSRLNDAQGRGLGAVVVLNDVTRLRRLETIRRDFVANVSHELRTPITSIKGFLETLRDGVTEPETARRFIDLAAKHAERLNAIIEDLLSLSRIEQETGKEQVVLERSLVRPAIDAAVLVCADKAALRGIPVETACAPDVEADVNRPLIEQALVNLIDNAIKYSESGRVVRVSAERAPGEVVLTVRDEGCGIPEEHLARVFERFYRVDPARSRKAGGTGLGLAIVKHIAQAHGGRVTVDSSVGRGSTFRIHLPVR